MNCTENSAKTRRTCVEMDAVNQVYATDNEKEKLLFGNDLLLKFCPLLNLIHKTISLR